MKVHHLNCGTDCPLGGALYDGRSKGLLARLVCHCLLVETSQGLVLIDTGYGLNDVRFPYPRLSRTFKALLNVRLRAEETAVRQIDAMGFRSADVRHIVLTHLDFDHAGGLEDFPHATVHVMRKELEASRTRSGFVARGRYRPMQIDGVSRWEQYGAGGDDWFGFEAVKQLHGLPPDIALVPLPGHTWGHAGVAVKSAGRWLLHAGDAYFYRGEMRSAVRHCTPGLRAYQRLMEVDRTSRLLNQQRLRELSIRHADEVSIICAHDPVELEQHWHPTVGLHSNHASQLADGGEPGELRGSRS